ncbi:MAG: hypothetical protein ACRDIB_03185, partial [Ardenticatenaceae bacterium]
MTHHEERLLAEQLDAFLDDQTPAPDALPPTEAATVQALLRSAAVMEPDPAFAARLEQRLRAMPLPDAPRPAANAGWQTWLGDLLRPAGRLAWGGLIALVVVGFALEVRALSQNPAQPADVPPALPASCQGDGMAATHVELARGYCFTYPTGMTLRGAGREFLELGTGSPQA